MSQNPIEVAREIYNVLRWGDGYFDINAEGHVVVFPTRRREDGCVDLHRLATEVSKWGLNLPVLFRFGDILRDRVIALCGAFDGRHEYHEYKGQLHAGLSHQGEPADVRWWKTSSSMARAASGSRPAANRSSWRCWPSRRPAPASSATAIRTASTCGWRSSAKQLGHSVYVVIEKLNELDLLLKEAAEMRRQAHYRHPRAPRQHRPRQVGTHRWREIQVRPVHRSRSSKRWNSFEADADARLACSSCTSTWVRRSPISAMCSAACWKPVAASRNSRNSASTSASWTWAAAWAWTTKALAHAVPAPRTTRVEQYANAIVRALWEICEEYELPHPNIITESGRAITAHHALMITEVVDFENPSPRRPLAAAGPRGSADPHRPVGGLRERRRPRAAGGLPGRAAYSNSEAQAMYTHGVLTLEQRAHAEQIYHATCRKVRDSLKPTSRAQTEAIYEINEKLADKYFCNMSRVPVHAGRVGHRPDLPHHADPSLG